MVQERWAVVPAHLFPYSSSKSSYPSLQAQTLTAGWGTWRAAVRPDTTIKNGCWCMRECQHDAAITHSYKKVVRLLSLDVVLIAGLLIIVSEQTVLRDRQVPGEDLHDWWFLYEARILCLSTSQLGRKKRHTVPDDKWELVSKILNTSRPTYSI